MKGSSDRFRRGDHVTWDERPGRRFVVQHIATPSVTDYNVAIASEVDARMGGARLIWVHPDDLHPAQ